LWVRFESVRADRMVAIVLLLQARGQMTAAELAEVLETSERTVRRDLDALLVAGLPLYSQRGRGGGWALLGGNRIDLSGFTVDEARALFMMAGTGSGPSVRSALRKVMAALPEPLRHAAAMAETASHVDPARWGAEAEEPPALPGLQAAVVSGQQIDIHYAKPGDEARWRRVHPYGLVAKAGVWYLLAGTADGRRTFRVSRVGAVAATDQPAERPSGFDLAEEWQEAERDYLSRMSLVEVELEVADDVVLRLSARLRGWVTVHELDSDRHGWRRFTAGFPHVDAAVGTLTPFGGSVRVISPDELRDKLLQLGKDLITAHS
jgi:predicted DNA-binding transcriptional regulator YafY